MPSPLREEIELALRRAGDTALAALAAAWRVVRPPLSVALQVVLALLLLFEEWGWRPLVEALGRLARFAPWARLERTIAGLPPYAALATLAAPTLLLFPLKFVALFLLANGQVITAGLLFAGAKIASTAIIARLFLLTKPQLMRIGWFAWGYDLVMPWKERLFATIRASWAWRYGRMLKTRVRLEAGRAWARTKPQLVALVERGRKSVAALGAEAVLLVRDLRDRLRG